MQASKNHTTGHLYKVANEKKRQVKQACKGRLLIGDSLERLKEIPDASIDSIVTDPPYELSFMGKAWDGTGIAYNVQLWAECLRVLKPGGHLLAFGATRTYHRMAVAIEDAGFEIRDSIHWVYGSGFPKSLDVSKAIDKQRHDRADIYKVTAWVREARDAAGITNKDIDAAFAANGMGRHWTDVLPGGKQPAVPTLEQVPQLLQVLGVTAEDVPEDIRRLLWDLNGHAGEPGENWAKREVVGSDTKARSTAGKSALPTEGGTTVYETWDITTAATDAAKQWQGWGTALKPAHEPIVMARKPLTGTVAATVLTHGTGALNIDGCRVGSPHSYNNKGFGYQADGVRWEKREAESVTTTGRWPANIIFDEAAGAELDTQAAVEAARFFYCPKAGKKERNAGLDGLEPRKGIRTNAPCKNEDVKTQPRRNFHPTVKPLALIRYLQRLVTPPGGTTLDPFMGSGTSAVAATLEGFEWKGCEMTADYLPIIKARVTWAAKEKRKEQPKLPIDGV